MITRKIKIVNFFHYHFHSIQNIAHHSQSLFDGVISACPLWHSRKGFGRPIGRLLKDGAVNMSDFWVRVELSIIIRKGIGEILLMWSGYMNPNNTNEGNIISSGGWWWSMLTLKMARKPVKSSRMRGLSFTGFQGKKCSIDIEDGSMICEDFLAINETNIPHLRTIL